MKSPAFQFYPGDWLRDLALRSCSPAARGIWIDMLCLMWDGSPKGHLKVNGNALNLHAIGRLIGVHGRTLERLLNELERAGVCTVEDGCYVSRRMARDEQVRASRAAGGHLGGNPALTSKVDVRLTSKDNHKANLEANLRPTPASASSSASSPEPYPTDKGAKAPSDGKPAKAKSASAEAVDLAWEVFDRYGVKRPTGGVVTTWWRQLRKNGSWLREILEELGPRGQLDKGEPFVFAVIQRRAKGQNGPPPPDRENDPTKLPRLRDQNREEREGWEADIRRLEAEAAAEKAAAAQEVQQ